MLALIAGRGMLPTAVAQAQDEMPLICALEGFAPEALAVDIAFRLETFGSFLAELRRRGVVRVCMCGAIRRPDIDPERIDAPTRPLVPVLNQALKAGDDGALRAIIGLFEAEGLEVMAAHDAAPGLLMVEGVHTDLRPAASCEGDVAAARKALTAMGRADLGQACVVVDGRVIATEDDSGTDAMLAGLPAGPATPEPDDADPLFGVLDTFGDLLGDAADWLSGPAARRRGILFKAPKPGQDRRADLPTVGPGTAERVARAGLAGIVIEAGGVLVLERAQMIADMNRAGLFLWSRRATV